MEIVFRWTFVVSLLIAGFLWFFKDSLPAPDFYGTSLLDEPIQLPTTQKPFSTIVNGQRYLITPKFDYELSGMIVSYHDADSFIDISHHNSWKDFLNLRESVSFGAVI